MSRDDEIRAAYARYQQAKVKIGTVGSMAARFGITPARLYQIVQEGECGPALAEEGAPREAS